MTTFKAGEFAYCYVIQESKKFCALPITPGLGAQKNIAGFGSY
jgi:hypothetical protein